MYHCQPHGFKMRLRGRDFHPLIRNVLFPSPTDVGSHNLPSWGPKLTQCPMSGSDTICNNPRPPLAELSSLGFSFRASPQGFKTRLLWDLTSVGKGNEAFLIRVWKPLFSRRILKTLRGSLKEKAQRGQYLLAVGLDFYKWNQSQSLGGVSARTLALRGVDCEIPHRLERGTKHFL